MQRTVEISTWDPMVTPVHIKIGNEMEMPFGRWVSWYGRKYFIPVYIEDNVFNLYLNKEVKSPDHDVRHAKLYQKVCETERCRHQEARLCQSGQYGQLRRQRSHHWRCLMRFTLGNCSEHHSARALKVPNRVVLHLFPIVFSQFGSCGRAPARCDSGSKRHS